MKIIKTFYGESRENDAIKFSQYVKGDYHMTWVFAGVSNNIPYCYVEGMTKNEAIQKGWVIP